MLAFGDFAEAQDWPMPYFPATFRQIREWLCHEAERLSSSGPLSAQTLRNSLDAIESWHVDLGLDTSMCSYARHKRLIVGACRTLNAA